MIPLKLADGPYPATVSARTKHVYLVAGHGEKSLPILVEVVPPV